MKLSILIILCLAYLLMASSTHEPRMTFTSKEMPFKSFHLSGGDNNPHIQLLQSQRNIVTVAAQKHLYSVDFQKQNPGESQKTRCINSDSASPDCQFNITVLHTRREANQLLLCGTNGRETQCCNMNMSEPSSLCKPSEDFRSMLNMKEGEPSLLIDSPGGNELYATQSGSEVSVGIHKVGRNQVDPQENKNEKRYVSLVVRSREDTQPHDKLYAFYKERNTVSSTDSDMWVPYVAQVCMADVGGPKSYMHYVWASLLSARLFCGDSYRRQHFSELLDVATLHEARWQDTRIYALFKNEWNMSAVCVYTIADIDSIFMTSTFKRHTGDIPTPRPGTCDVDSDKLPREVLRVVEEHSEMVDQVVPLNNSVPLFASHHHYTHVRLERVQQHTVLFLSLESGRVHKVLVNKNQAFFIAEYQPFNHRAHILDMTLHLSAPTGKLYVASHSHVVQVDVESCSQYGDSCQDCVLARDPYCGWNGTRCVPSTRDTLQDVEGANHGACKSLETEPTAKKVHRSSSGRAEEEGDITVALGSRYFLRCAARSRHASYSWNHDGRTTPCTPADQQCLLLIDGMSPEDAGNYTCVSVEMGYVKTLVQYQLRGAAGRASCPLAWVCLMVVMTMKTLFC